MDRGKRYNAGNRMSKLLDEEDDCPDEFYKENYGGFENTESDNEYQAEEEGEDVVDSDFSIDEDDEPISDIEDADNPRKKRRLVTKAYKEPVASTSGISKPKPKPAIPKEKTDPNDTSIDSSERKSKRKSTAAKTAETVHRMKVRDQESKQRPKKAKEEELIPTQEELLEEAKITAQENLKSLERYQKLEDEKKTRKIGKKQFTGPTIRYTSTRVPLIEETNDETTKVCERTVISIQNDPHNITFNKIFGVKPASKAPRLLYCGITGLPARYVDPLTSVPFRNSSCFKACRLTYYKQLLAKGNTNHPSINKFHRWFSNQHTGLKKELIMQAQKLKMGT
ncbi:unnamed protein product [Ceutorhynchus assimilis]|uniref:Vacuolar protein sorting-associated protein 72 homolog n=1 Tax=Ceutorhynchus assimilis TaxID=467358 RepID=A0A9N9QSU3_9CUCU|nr:unnamed protein product [Ceutorhynchus assimilis]